jgi:Hypothetical protein (DUF2513)
VKRDDDLIRKLLFEFEESEDWLIEVPGITLDAAEDDRKARYHMYLLADEGMLVAHGKYTMRMTSRGHDFLDAIRSDTIWNKTKAGAASLGGVTLGMLKDIAFGYLKQEAAVRLGIPL